MILFYICAYPQDKLILSNGSLIDSPIHVYDNARGISNGTLFRTFLNMGGDGMESQLMSISPLEIISTLGVDYSFTGVCINENIVCTVGNKPLTATSAIFNIDGSNKTISYSLSSSIAWKSVCFGNGNYVAVGTNADNPLNLYYAVSSDGITWIEDFFVTSSVNNPQISFGNNTFLIVDGLRYISSNGTSWTTVSDSNISYSECAFTGEHFLTFDDTLFVSSDGITGIRKILPYPIRKVYSSNNMLLVTGITNYDSYPYITPIAISTDVGNSWITFDTISEISIAISLTSTTKPLFWTQFIKTYES